MTLFLFLLVACAVGGFLLTALIWVFFWTTGIFEIPLTVRSKLGIPVRDQVDVIRYGEIGSIFILPGQSGIARANLFGNGEPAPPLFAPLRNSPSASEAFVHVLP